MLGGTTAEAQDLGWEHWKQGDVVQGENYTLRVIRADASGAGWEEIEVKGTGFEVFRAQTGAPAGVTRDVRGSRLYLLRGVTGIQAAFAAGKIPAWARDELLAEEQSRLGECPPDPVVGNQCQHLYVVSRAALTNIAKKQSPSRVAADAPSSHAAFEPRLCSSGYKTTIERSYRCGPTEGQAPDDHQAAGPGETTPAARDSALECSGAEATMKLTEHVEMNPQVMLGKPVIRGTRIPVELILRKLGEGASQEDLLDAYPRLTSDAIRGALAFAADYLAHEDIVLAKP